jgi:hypothetical protein
MFVPGAKAGAIWAAVLTCVGVYVILSVFKLTPYHNNPGFLATAGIVAAWIVVAVSVALQRAPVAEGVA